MQQSIQRNSQTGNEIHLLSIITLLHISRYISYFKTYFFTLTWEKTFDKKFAIPLDFHFFKHPVYPYGLKEDLIVRLELNSSEKVILCTGDTTATYRLSDILLEYDAIFDKPYATAIGEMYNWTTLIPYTKVTLIHYQTQSKKDTTWKIDVTKLSVRSLQILLSLFLDKRDDSANKNEAFCNPSIKKF